MTKQQAAVLFELAELDGFEITKMDYSEDEGSMTIYASSSWGSGEDSVEIEDPIVELWPGAYRNLCDFSDGFGLDMTIFTQWSLWCGFLEPIDFDKMLKGLNKD